MSFFKIVLFHTTTYAIRVANFLNRSEELLLKKVYCQQKVKKVSLDICLQEEKSISLKYPQFLCQIKSI